MPPQQLQLCVSTLIFDMDGVITDTMPYHYRAWKTVFALAGVDVSHEDIYKREGQKGIDSVRELFAEKNVRPAGSRLYASLLRSKERLFKDIFERRFIPGSRSFIKKCVRRGFKVALVTGTSRHEARKLLPDALWNLFDATVCGSDVHNGKPHPEPYLKAMAQLKVSPSRAVVFENAPFGISSAKSAGLYCIALETSLPSPYLHKADAIFPSFKQIECKVEFVRAAHP